jgi:hypothetical protein
MDELTLLDLARKDWWWPAFVVSVFGRLRDGFAVGARGVPY